MALAPVMRASHAMGWRDALCTARPTVPSTLCWTVTAWFVSAPVRGAAACCRWCRSTSRLRVLCVSCVSAAESGSSRCGGTETFTEIMAHAVPGVQQRWFPVSAIGCHRESLGVTPASAGPHLNIEAALDGASHFCSTRPVPRCPDTRLAVGTQRLLSRNVSMAPPTLAQTASASQGRF